MARLEQVVLELQEQNKTLDDVKENIKTMLAETIADRQQYQRDEGKREEERREAQKDRNRNRRSSKAPTTLTQGLSEGIGLAGLIGGLKSLVAPFLGSAAGVLGGMTLSGLIGKGIGRLFWGAVGAFLGIEYLGPLIDNMIPDIVGKLNVFGEGSDAWTVEDIAAAVSGAVALWFGPKLLGKAISTSFGYVGKLIAGQVVKLRGEDYVDDVGRKKIKDRTKGQSKRFGRGLIRNVGLAGLIGFVGDLVGTEMGKLTGSAELENAITSTAEWAALGMLIGGPKAALALGIASLVYSGAKFALTYFDKRRAELDEILKRDIDKSLEEAAAAADAQMKAAKLKIALAQAAARTPTAGGMPELDPAQKAQMQEQLDYIKGKDAEEYRKLEALSAPFMTDRAIGTADPQAIFDAAFGAAIVKLGDSRPDLLLKGTSEQLKSYLATASGVGLEGFRSDEGFYSALDKFMETKAPYWIQEFQREALFSQTFRRGRRKPVIDPNQGYYNMGVSIANEANAETPSQPTVLPGRNLGADLGVGYDPTRTPTVSMVIAKQVAAAVMPLVEASAAAAEAAQAAASGGATAPSGGKAFSQMGSTYHARSKRLDKMMDGIAFSSDRTFLD